MKHITCLAIALVALTGSAQDSAVKTTPGGTVTIQSAGNDVRMILHSLFTQANKNYVLEPYTYHALHLNLANIEFEEALQLVCKVAKLTYEVQNGIYFVSKPKPATTQPKIEANVRREPATPAAELKGQLPKTVLDKKVLTRLQKTDMRAVFAEFAKQTAVAIEVNKNVPAYKVDAFLINTSLRYSLDKITKAAGLQYRFTDRQSIEVFQPEKPQSPAAPNAG